MIQAIKDLWNDESPHVCWKGQVTAIAVSVSMLALFTWLTYWIIYGMNQAGYVGDKVLSLNIIWYQVLLGMFIYLKTAVDYAIYVGRLMGNNTGFRARIAMNAGTSAGAFIGVTAVLIVWMVFNQVPILMIIMLLVAGAILLGLGDGSAEHYEDVPNWLKTPLNAFFETFRPVYQTMTWFMPDICPDTYKRGFWSLFILSGLLPFFLGADDLAGYMVLLDPSNTFSLLVGIYLADCFIDIALFLNQKLTVKIVKNRWISYFGAIVFVVLALWSFGDAIMLILDNFSMGTEILTAMALGSAGLVIYGKVTGKWTEEEDEEQVPVTVPTE
jgi:hypothetical protein